MTRFLAHLCALPITIAGMIGAYACFAAAGLMLLGLAVLSGIETVFRRSNEVTHG